MRPIALLLLAAILSCDGNGEPWSPCAVTTAIATTRAECAIFERPRAGTMSTLPVAVTRLPAPAEMTAQLWMLQGGPGGSGTSLVDAAVELQRRMPGLEIELLDHRGTGRSSYLGCPSNDLVACAADIARSESLSAYQTGEAARDLGALIERLRVPGKPVLVWGGSYGAYWAHRYVEQTPDRVDGVILDSGCLATTCDVSTIDRDLEDEARIYLERCGADASCAAHAGIDPWSTTRGLAARIASGWCAEAKLDQAGLRSLLALVALETPTLLPPLVHRLDRCDARDARAFAFMRAALTRPGGGDPGFSSVLQDTVVLSELWHATSDVTAPPNAVISTGQVARWSAEWPAWPRYVPDADATTWAKTKVPILVIRGARDLRLRPDVSAEGAKRLGVREVVVPDAGHGVLLHSACGTSIIVAFLRQPQAALDVSCTTLAAPIELRPDEKASTAFFGTPDAWDGAPP